MKKNFMTRALSVVLSAAMALSLSVVANVASADAAAAKPAFKKAQKTIAETKKQVKFYTTAKTKKNFTLTKVKNTSTDVKVSVNKAKQVITVKRAADELAADTSATIKCTFKNKKTTKKVTKNIKVNVKANKAEEEVKVEALALKLEATKNDTLVATVNKDIKSISPAAIITVTKDELTTAVEAEKIDISDDGLTVTFQGKAKFTKGTYKMTIKTADEEASASVAVTDEAATQIKITSTMALTNANPVDGVASAGALAYIYYDVVNQYGESVRTSVNLSWNTSAGQPTVDQVNGKLTVKNGDGSTPFMYNSEIFVVGVDTKTGLNYNTSIKVGMSQKLDTVDMVGFLDTKNPTDKITSLPPKFEDDRYVLLFQAKDQDKNVIDGVTNKDVTFFTSDVTIIDSTKLKPVTTAANVDTLKVYTVKGAEYYGVAIASAMYYDKGGDVTITAISNGTGAKTEKVFTVGAGARLQSITLQAPDLVTDGDEVELKYVAKDTNGNEITDYESIVRSTNSINLNATEGTLTISENNDGTAKITWKDGKGVDFATTDFNEMDGQDRIVSLSVVVVGGESSILQLNVKDAKRPVAIKKITAADGLVARSSTSFKLDPNDKGYSTIYFKDQYGGDVKESRAYNFFIEAAKTDDGTNYGIQLDFVDGTNNFKDTTGVTQTDVIMQDVTTSCCAIKLKDITGEKVEDVVKVTIVAKDDVTITPVGMTTKSNPTMHTIAEYPYDLVKDAVVIKDIGLLCAQDSDLPLYDYASVAEYNAVNRYDTAGVISSTKFGDMDIKTGVLPTDANKIGFSVSYDGKTMDVAADYFVAQAKTGSDVVALGTLPTELYPQLAVASFGGVVSHSALEAVKITSGKIDVISGNTINVGALYDANGRKASTDVTLTVLRADTGIVSGSGASKTWIEKPTYLKKTFKISDENEKVATFALTTNWYDITVSGENMTLNATDVKIALDKAGKTIKNQYGKDITRAVSYELSDAKESTSALTHIDKSFKFVSNNTTDASLEGAELGDTFTVKATCGGMSATYKATMGSDKSAYISTADTKQDENFRKNVLGMAR